MSLSGTTGLVETPTARIISDGRVAFGLGYTDKYYALFSPGDAQLVYYVTVGYLPFLEVGLRITTFPEDIRSGILGWYKDRMANVKWLILDEGPYMPSILLGGQDIYGDNMRYNALYAVMSKSVRLPRLGTTDVHLGYASDLMKAQRHTMIGVFGGVEIEFHKYLTVMVEYDTRKYSAGLRIMLWGDRVNIDAVALGLKRLSGGMSIALDL